MELAGAQRRRECDTTRLKDLAVDSDFHLNQIVQIPDDVAPLQRPLLAAQPVVEFLAQQQRPGVVGGSERIRICRGIWEALPDG